MLGTHYPSLTYTHPSSSSIKPSSLLLKLPIVCTNYLLTEYVPIIYHPICKPTRLTYLSLPASPLRQTDLIILPILESSANLLISLLIPLSKSLVMVPKQNPVVPHLLIVTLCRLLLIQDLIQQRTPINPMCSNLT